MNDIITAIISGCLTLLGTVITVIAANMKTRHEIAVNQAIQQTKLDDLSREVREHNNFARRMPVVEEQIKIVNHRLSALEQRTGGKD